MNKRQAKIRALRTAAGDIANEATSGTYEDQGLWDDLSDRDQDKVTAALFALAQELQDRADRLEEKGSQVGTDFEPLEAA